ncbi:MAG: polysaccharide biosynthesis/export family protein [Cyclobacteriaceae bacterium]|nr:polysaccharide biosynthesis/export family protein [Cyclobacteriaceae bacterium]
MPIKQFTFFRIISLILSAHLLSSCVTNKKYVYLQKDDVNVRALPKDSVVRTYDLHEYEYKIQTEDNLSVRFESLTPEEYDIFNRSTGVTPNQNMNLNVGNAIVMGELVDPQGEIMYPVIGKVKVAGLSVYEAQVLLQELADKYLESPVVKVRLINFRFTILGEAKREGTTILPNNRVSFIEALGLAGGLTDMADKRNLKLIRQIDGKTQIRYLDLLDENFIGSPEYFVHQNDILIIPALRQRPYQTYFGKNLALLISSLSLLLITVTLINTSK